jgi:hypothetical protein
VGQGLLCLATKQQASYAAPTVRAHYDEIAALRRGRVENSLVGMSIARMHCVAENSGRLRDGRRFVQELLPGPMAVWGLIVATGLVIGSIPAFLRLIDSRRDRLNVR